MYLKNIAIKNIGPIDKLSVDLPFQENGDPKPIIFVGENGSGKTILQSQIIDGFYEIGGKLFDDIMQSSGLGHKYYKISGGVNLLIGKREGFSLLKFIDNENNEIEYLDKIGKVKKEDFTELMQNFSLALNDKNDNQKTTTEFNEIQKKKLQDEWLSGVHFYQPAYRYEEPFWKNYSFMDQAIFEDNIRFAGKLNKEIEIITATKENKSYLMDLVLDFMSNPKDVVNLKIWQSINDILSKIKQKTDIRFGIGPQGGYRVNIVEIVARNRDGSEKQIRHLLPSIDNLSLGESILLNLFVNIIRHGNNPPKSLNQIQGIVAIDEIDVHLHTDLQSNVLPNLIEMFPKIQFIITTHSPLFLLGMKKVFGEKKFEIRNMPNGEVITIERFSEFENAYNVLKKTAKFENMIRDKIEKSRKSVLFVEGDCDNRYLKRAIELLEENDILSKIQIYDTNGFGGLNKIWKGYDSKLSEVVPQNILLLYDCDQNIQNSQKGKIFKRGILTIRDSIIDKGIENLFSKATLLKAIAHKKAFIDITPEISKIKRGKNITIPEKYEINPDEKSDLCDWLCTNGTKEDFHNFENIFRTIKDTIISEKTEG